MVIIRLKFGLKRLFSLLKAWAYYLQGKKTEYVLLLINQDLKSQNPEQINGIDFDDILDLFD